MTRKEDLSAITLTKQGELRFFCQKFTLMSKINVRVCVVNAQCQRIKSPSADSEGLLLARYF